MFTHTLSSLAQLEDYEWINSDHVPWKRLEKDLTECKVALMTTAGIYITEGQKPFTHIVGKENISYRAIPKMVNQSDIRVSHDGMELDDTVGRDMNVIFPIHRLHELEEEKIIAAVADEHYSTGGDIRNPRLFVTDTLPKIRAKLQESLVDTVILAPTTPLAHQLS